jgi:hypothetical protein
MSVHYKDTSFSTGIQISKQRSVKRTTRDAQKLEIIGFIAKCRLFPYFSGKRQKGWSVLCVMFLFSKSMRGALLSCKILRNHLKETYDELPLHTQRTGRKNRKPADAA